MGPWPRLAGRASLPTAHGLHHPKGGLGSSDFIVGGGSSRWEEAHTQIPACLP